MNRTQRGFRAQKLIPIINRTCLLLLSLVLDSVPLSAYRPPHTPSLSGALAHAVPSA